tara:strand:+ start:736 stop:903 length:168 start_codon:yes stop_codon:yes gene_type:complete
LPGLAPGHIHEAQNLNIAIGGEVMALGLQVHGVNNSLPEFVIGYRVAAQNPPKVD